MLPFFVYGTLLSSESNVHFWKKSVTSRRRAHLCGARLFDLGPYPMLVRAEDAETEAKVWGEVVEVEPNFHAAILRALDRLEGVRSDVPTRPGGLFHRECVEVKVMTDAGSKLVNAWTYWGKETVARRGRPVACGDWKWRFK